MFREELDEALKVLSLASIDPRLDSKSELYAVTSKTQHTPPLDKMFAVPATVRSNFHAQKSYLHEDVEDKLEPDELGSELDELGDDKLGDELGGPDKLGDEFEDDLGGAGDEIPGLSSGSSYTVEMAKGQLDGIIGKWMDLAGNYSEGDERHKFLEIGERLREISAVLNRDFIGKR